MKRLFYCLLALSLLTLSACGQSGPLYLPNKHTPPVPGSSDNPRIDYD